MTGPSAHADRRALFALFFATVAVFSDLYVTQPILPLLSREFGVPAPTAALTLSVVVLMIALVSSAWGPLADAFGRKPVMVWSCALLALPTLLCAAAPTLSVLVLLRGAQGLLVPGVTAVAVAYLGDQFVGPRLGPAVGGWVAASVLGGLTGRVGSGWIASHSTWRTPFVVFGVVTLAAALAMALFLPPSVRRGRVSIGLAYLEMLRHLRDRRLVGGFIIGGTVFFGFIGIFTYLPYYLTAAPFRLSTGSISAIYLVYGAGVLTSIAVGNLSGRYGRRSLMATGFVIAAGAAALSLVPVLPVVILALVVLCVGMFFVQGTAPAFVNATALEAKGGAGALYTTFYYVGATLGSVLPGYAWQAFGWPGVVAACIVAFGSGLLADLVLSA